MISRCSDQRFGPMTHLVKVARHFCYVHIDHMLKTKRVNSKQALESDLEILIPLSVPESVLSTPPRTYGSKPTSKQQLAQAPTSVTAISNQFNSSSTKKAVPKSLSKSPVVMSETDFNNL